LHVIACDFIPHQALVARTLRLVESSQQMIRIVGLSATLPNYADVALFLKVMALDGLLMALDGS
jgi:replicative superfamily II helicase